MSIKLTNQKNMDKVIPFTIDAYIGGNKQPKHLHMAYGLNDVIKTLTENEQATRQKGEQRAGLYEIIPQHPRITKANEQPAIYIIPADAFHPEPFVMSTLATAENRKAMAEYERTVRAKETAEGYKYMNEHALDGKSPEELLKEAKAHVEASGIREKKQWKPSERHAYDYMNDTVQAVLSTSAQMTTNPPQASEDLKNRFYQAFTKNEGIPPIEYTQTLVDISEDMMRNKHLSDADKQFLNGINEQAKQDNYYAHAIDSIISLKSEIPADPRHPEASPIKFDIPDDMPGKSALKRRLNSLFEQASPDMATEHQCGTIVAVYTQFVKDMQNPSKEQINALIDMACEYGAMAHLTASSDRIMETLCSEKLEDVANGKELETIELPDWTPPVMMAEYAVADTLLAGETVLLPLEGNNVLSMQINGNQLEIAANGIKGTQALKLDTSVTKEELESQVQEIVNGLHQREMYIQYCDAACAKNMLQNPGMQQEIYTDDNSDPIHVTYHAKDSNPGFQTPAVSVQIGNQTVSVKLNNARTFDENVNRISQAIKTVRENYEGWSAAVNEPAEPTNEVHDIEDALEDMEVDVE